MNNHAVLGLGVLGLALTLGCVGETAPDEVIGERADEFSTAPSEPNHEQITSTALAFLSPAVLNAVIAGDVSTDVQFALLNTAHFDDCNFSGGSALVAANQAAAVQALDPSVPPLVGDAQAILAFSRSLHGVQDFYAHTNWVELGSNALVDQSLTAFPALTPYSTIPSSGFVVVQGNKPSHTALSREDDAPYPQYAIVTVHRQKATAPGLVSGTVDYEPGDYCPAGASITHADLNKDKSTIPGRTAQHFAAKALAIRQTRHEWCRLNQLAHDAWGDAGTARLATWVADPSALPNCATE
ncbi:MAG: hypothetical protein ABJE95_34580 [Byssovorax sp.]